jgi:NADH:ubiquinone oxidoreductase subunit 4 (subunit M)
MIFQKLKNQKGYNDAELVAFTGIFTSVFIIIILTIFRIIIGPGANFSDIPELFIKEQITSENIQPVIEIKDKTKKIQKLEKNLSIKTWFMLIILMIVVTKISHKISLKTIFKPTKKVSKHVKKEWDES